MYSKIWDIVLALHCFTVLYQYLLNNDYEHGYPKSGAAVRSFEGADGTSRTNAIVHHGLGGSGSKGGHGKDDNSGNHTMNPIGIYYVSSNKIVSIFMS